VKRHAKAPSAGSIDGSGKRRGLFGRAFASRAASSDANGSGAHPHRRALIVLTVAITLTTCLASGAASASAAPPALTIDPVGASAITTAHVSGTIDSDALFSEWFFETSTNGTDWIRSNLGGFTEAADPEVVEGALEGLTGGISTYEARLSAYSFEGPDQFVVVSSSAVPFTTDPAPNAPVVALDAPTPNYQSAHIQGTVDPEGGNLNSPGNPVPIHWAIETSETGDPDTWTEAASGDIIEADAEGSAPIAVSADPPLSPGTLYHYRLRATYAGQSVETDPAATLTTLAVAKPTVVLDAITTHTDTSAQLSVHINPNAPGSLTPAAEAAFETTWLLSCTPECLTLTIPGGTVAANEGEQTFSSEASGLEPNTSYEVTLEASNAGGPSSALKSFTTTEIPPTVKAGPGASDGKGGYILEGAVNPHNSTIISCEFKYGPTTAYGQSIPCESSPAAGNKPVEVTAHPTGLTPGATYHFVLVATNGAGPDQSPDATFVPTFVGPAEGCPNEALRAENNSLSLPECRAYEQVTPSNKAGYPAIRFTYSDDGPAVGYLSHAGNIANSGQGSAGAGLNHYVSVRSSTGWETLSNLNGPSGSLYSEPDALNATTVPQAYSSDLRSSLWWTNPHGESRIENYAYLRKPDGSFALIGGGSIHRLPFGAGEEAFKFSSVDLSHVVIGTSYIGDAPYGPGLYEFVGTGNGAPHRVDLDNSGQPISECPANEPFESPSAVGKAMSTDGRTIFLVTLGGCGGAGPPADEVWARVDGTTSFDISQSQCTRSVSDPGGVCNAPADATFQGAATNGSRVFFTTTQQLVNADTDQTNDLYACDIPAGTPTPTGTANPCPSLTEVSGGVSGARVEAASRSRADNGGQKPLAGFLPLVSPDGSTVFFVAQGVLATNHDAFGQPSMSGNFNLYAWREDASHPAGQTTFIGRLNSLNDVTGQSTSDGHYFAFTAASPLVPTDTDSARDVYRYNDEDGVLVRVSTNTSGVGGNVDGLDATLDETGNDPEQSTPTPGRAVSSDGSAIVFSTSDPLSPLDHNGAEDVYLWKDGRVSLISPGSVGGGGSEAAISGEGQDIYFATRQQLTSGDGDDVLDVYDARIGGGFTALQQTASCLGEACQPKAAELPTDSAPGTGKPGTDGNVKPRQCARKRVLRKGHCVGRPPKKKHHNKRRRAQPQRIGLKRGGEK
jgi:hypothetical protein